MFLEFQVDKNRIFYADETGKLLAEVTFPEEDSGIINVNHTFVDESLRGQGVAGKLMKAVADYAQTNQKQIHPTCSYAVKWFGDHTEYSSLLK